MNDVEVASIRDAAQCDVARLTYVFVYVVMFACGCVVLVVSVISLKEAHGNTDAPVVSIVLWVVFLLVGTCFVAHGLKKLVHAVVHADLPLRGTKNSGRKYTELDDLELRFDTDADADLLDNSNINTDDDGSKDENGNDIYINDY